jgi:N-acetylmuramoyl-L-alanine amidase
VPGRLRGPIANSRNVPLRTRRRRAPSAPLRTALALALVVVLALVISRVIDVAGRPATIGGHAAAAPAKAGGAVSQPSVPGLESSACMSFAPTHGHLDRTVYIDAGHGGLDPGVVGMTPSGRTVLEKDATLAVALRLAGLLRGDGYTVVLSRTQDTTVLKLSAADSSYGAITSSAEHRDLAARAACANATAANVLVSIHFDGYSDPSVGGTETFYDAARSFATANHSFATDLQAALVARLGEADRGVWTDDQLAAPTLTGSGSSYNHLIELGPMSQGWVDDPSQMPGALVEPLFVTNPAEALIASDPAGQQKIAEALESGVLKFLSAAA